MKHKFISLFILLLFSITCLTINVNAKENEKNKDKKLEKTAGLPITTYLNVNNISTVFWNQGYSDIDVNDDNSGLVFPKGSGRQAVFKSGFMWGAQVAGDPQVRVGGSSYRTGLQGGKILSPGVAEDPDLVKNRIYRVRPDIIPPSGPRQEGYQDGSVVSEVADNEGSAIDIIDQYYLDWSEWPAADGAEYTDVDSNGAYDPAIDIPGVPGADQTIWYVANDLDPTRTQFLYGALPLGIEMQATIWAYARSGALGNMFFRKYKIINKSNITFDSMYVCMWSDVDLGNSGDDYAGSDTTLSLVYCYNANAVDGNYDPLPPPAVGFDFFQGPIVDGNPEDEAIFGGKKIIGKVNLPMTAAFYFARGDPAVTDPTQGSPLGSDQYYNFFRGRVGLSGEIFVDPNTGLATTFALSGDPVTRTGWIDGQDIGPGDRRIGQASGPFTMAAGDTQEVVVAEIVAGAIPGVDRLSAIGLMKFYDQEAQSAYDNFFDLPLAPPAPRITVPGNTVIDDGGQTVYYASDNQIVLNWSENTDRVKATEVDYESKGFTFQGYNVYQLPNRAAGLSEAVRLATFDVNDGIGKITENFFDAATGVVSEGVAQFGNDTQISRFIALERDAFKDRPLINGIRYYYAVTAYSYNPDAKPNNLESPLSIITVIPTSDNPGVRPTYLHGDTIAVSHASGVSDGSVVPLVIDANKLTGDSYEVTFDEVDDATVWNLTNTSTSTQVLTNQTNQSGDDEYATVDGMLLKAIGPPPGVKDWDVPQGTRRFTWGNADGFEWEGFNGAIGYGSPFAVFGPGPEPIAASDLKNVLLILARVPDTTTFENPSIDPSDPNVSYGYRFGRGFGDPPALPEFAPYILSANTDGYTYQDFTPSVPLSAWDVNDPENPRRLAVAYLENNAEGALLDGRYWPGDNGGFNNTAGTGPREWLFILDEDYSETPNAAWTDIINDPVPVMYWCTFNRRGKVPFSYDLETGVGESGDDHFLITYNRINIPGDIFTFTATAPTNTVVDAKEDVKAINVFPNPYYAVNSEEINKYNRFVTFTHLPQKAKIRLFDLAGTMVKVIDKDSPQQYVRWDLANERGFPVASGLYIAYIELPDLGGETKILKLAIIQEQQILDRF